MPDAKINGAATKPIPASVKAAIAKGYPKALAQSMGGTKRLSVPVKP